MKKLCLLTLSFLFLVHCLTHVQAQINDESKIPPYILPAILQSPQGKTITSSVEWEKSRRSEILQLFEAHVYGQVPTDYDSLQYTYTNQNALAMEGKATLKEVAIRIFRKRRSVVINLVLFVPNQVQGPVPVFLLINNRNISNMDPTRQIKNDFWPAELVIEKGYAVAAFHVDELAVSSQSGYRHGVLHLYPEQVNDPNGMKVLGTWAWGASRVLDYFQKDSHIDPAKVALVGHSRGGKAALWCGAQDQRFAMIMANCSGRGGAPLYRRRFGESLKDITTEFPYWFNDRLQSYIDNEDALPVDTHMLMALMAPRPMYLGHASEDLKADPKGAFLAQKHAEEVYGLYGISGMPVTDLPQPNQPVIKSHLGHHVRRGTHNLTRYDWSNFIAFASHHYANNHIYQGKGSGLTATYYNSTGFTGATVNRLDPSINFTWKNTAPETGISPEQFSVRWEGNIEPKYSETYTFHTLADNGIRVWINDQLVIDKAATPTETEHTGQIALEARKQYPIRIEYIKKAGNGIVRLFWSSVRQSREVVPTDYLYPAPVSSLYEAETASLVGGEVKTEQQGYTGTGFVAYTAGGSIEWTIQVDSASAYQLIFRYMNAGSKNQPVDLSINDKAVLNPLDLKPAEKPGNWQTITVTTSLQAGVYKIKLAVAGTAAVIIDHLRVLAYTGEEEPVLTHVETMPASYWQIFPNPAADEITVASEHALIDDIQILNSLGVLVARTSTPGTKQIGLAIHNLPAGIYVVKIHTLEGRTTSRKILVSR